MPTPTGVVYPTQATTAVPGPAAACRVLAIPGDPVPAATFRSKVPASLSDPGTTTETRRCGAQVPEDLGDLAAPARVEREDLPPGAASER
ncbi:hypothetical protein SBADM41S_05037 [Streptomyces badius]